MQQNNTHSPHNIDRPYQRHIALEGAYNVRDLGGYPTSHGRTVKWGRLFRGDGLHRLTEADQRTLVGHNIHTVIDLRFVNEATAAPSKMANIAGVDYRHVPLHDDQVAPAFSSDIKPSQLPQTLDEYYCMVLDRCQNRIQLLFTMLCESATLPCLYHCTAGKDRTGMLTMLVLSALDVPREIIVEDYTMTAEFAAPLLSKLSRQMQKDGVDVEWHRRMLDCSPRIMNRTIDYLNQRYGGAENYLYKIGVTAIQLNALRADMIADY